MLLSWLALMLTRDLLVSASHPFQWRFCEADWFIQTTGLETLSQLRDFFNLQGRKHSATQLEECLSAAPHPDVRSGSELNLAFWSGWAEFELGVYRTPAPRVNLAAVVPTVPGGSRGRSQAPPSPTLGHVGRVAAAVPVGPSPPSSSGKKRRLQVGPNASAQPASAFSRKTQKAALQIARDSNLCTKAVENLRDNFYAQSTVNSHLCQVKLYEEICKEKSMSPFPITHDSLELFAAIMVEAGYCPRSIPQYVSAIIRQQRLLQHPIDPAIQDWKSIVLRAAKRGSGDSFRVLPFTSRMLQQFRDLCLCGGFLAGHVQMFLFRILTVTWFFLLRSDEAVGSEEFRGLSPSSFHFDTWPSRKVTVILGETKTNSEGLICKRTLECCCDPSESLSGQQRLLPLCPFCAANLLVKDSVKASKRLDSRKAALVSEIPDSAREFWTEPLRPGDGSSSPKSSVLLAFLREGLRLIHVTTVNADGRELYGTHSLRRGAAQALVVAGWSLEAIKFFGRWLSSCVELYLLSVPMEQFGQDVSASMLRASGLSGANATRKSAKSKPSFEGAPVLSFRKSCLQAGVRLQAFLPELLEHSEADDDDDLDQSVGWFAAQVESILPVTTVDSSARSSTEIIIHDSLRQSFPLDFADFSKRKSTERCALLSIAPDHPLVAVCFSRVMHRFS